MRTYRNPWLRVSVGATPGQIYQPGTFGGPQQTGDQPVGPGTPLPPVTQPHAAEWAELNRRREAANTAAQIAEQSLAAVDLDRAISLWRSSLELAEELFGSALTFQERSSALKAVEEARNAMANLEALKSTPPPASPDAPTEGPGLGFFALLAAAAFAAWRYLR